MFCNIERNKTLYLCKTSYIKPIKTKIQLYALTKRVKQNKCFIKFVRIEPDLNSNGIAGIFFTIQNIFIVWIWFESFWFVSTSGLPSSGDWKSSLKLNESPPSESMSLKGSRHYSLVDPMSTAPKILAAFQPLRTIPFPFSNVISSYRFISHFACNGFIVVSGIFTSIHLLQDLYLNLL